MKKDFIPRRDGDLNTWEANFKTKLAEHGPTLGLTAGEMTDVVDPINVHTNAYAEKVTASAAAKAATSENKAKKTLAIDAIRVSARAIKTKSAYTEEIGNELGTIGEEDTFDPVTAKPTLKVSESGLDVVIRFDKPSSVDGVKIFSKRGNETAFTFLAIDTQSPYTDSRENLTAGQAEQRTYRALYYDDDDIIGLQSDDVSISITK